MWQRTPEPNLEFGVAGKPDRHILDGRDVVIHHVAAHEDAKVAVCVTGGGYADVGNVAGSLYLRPQRLEFAPGIQGPVTPDRSVAQPVEQSVEIGAGGPDIIHHHILKSNDESFLAGFPAAWYDEPAIKQSEQYHGS